VKQALGGGVENSPAGVELRDRGVRTESVTCREAHSLMGMPPVVTSDKDVIDSLVLEHAVDQRCAGC